jgi:hypothetical protein
MNNIKIFRVSVIKVRNEPIAMLNGKNVREFTDVKFFFVCTKMSP